MRPPLYVLPMTVVRRGQDAASPPEAAPRRGRLRAADPAQGPPAGAAAPAGRDLAAHLRALVALRRGDPLRRDRRAARRPWCRRTPRSPRGRLVSAFAAAVPTTDDRYSASCW